MYKPVVSAIALLIISCRMGAMETPQRVGTPIPTIQLPLHQLDTSVLQDSPSARRERERRMQFSRDKSLKQLPSSPRSQLKSAQQGSTLVPPTPVQSPQVSPDRRTGSMTNPYTKLAALKRSIAIHDDSELPVLPATNEGL